MKHILNNAIEGLEKPWVTLNEGVLYYNSLESTPSLSPLTKVWYKDGTTEERDLTTIFGDGGIYAPPSPTTQFSLSAQNITKIKIGTNVTSIGDSAFGFYGISNNLTNVAMPNSVTSIGNCAFYGCTSLTNIEISSAVTSIGNSAFYVCTSLTSVTIPNSVVSIGNMAFYSCSGIISVEIPNSVISIGNYAFKDCSFISVTLPNSVTSIGKEAFACRSLTSVTYNGVIYTSRSALTTALTSNGVTVGDDVFIYTKLSN